MGTVFFLFCHSSDTDSFDGNAAEHSNEENVVDDAAKPGCLIPAFSYLKSCSI